MIEAIYNTILSLCAAGIMFCLCIIGRNVYVYRFLGKIIDLADAAADKRIDADRKDWMEPLVLCDKHTYTQLLFSFKPLKLKYWFTEEEIKILKGEK